MHGEELVIGGSHELGLRLAEEHNEKARQKRAEAEFLAQEAARFAPGNQINIANRIGSFTLRKERFYFASF